MEEVQPDLKAELGPRLRGKLQQRQRSWTLISGAVYSQVLSHTTAQFQALLLGCEEQRSTLDAALRTNMDQITASKEHVCSKIQAMVLPQLEPVLESSVRPYVSSILEALMKPVSRGFSEVRQVFSSEMMDLSTTFQNQDHELSYDRLRELLGRQSTLAFHPVKMRSCYEQLDHLDLKEFQERFNISGVNLFSSRAQILLREQMDNAVFTLETLLSQSESEGEPEETSRGEPEEASRGDRLDVQQREETETQQGQELCRRIQKCQDRVLKKFDHDSSATRKRFFHEALLQMLVPFVLQQLEPRCSPELPHFQEMIFADFSEFLPVENLYEDVVAQAVSKDVVSAIKEPILQHKYHLYQDSIGLNNSDPSLHLPVQDTPTMFLTKEPASSPPASAHKPSIKKPPSPPPASVHKPSIKEPPSSPTPSAHKPSIKEPPSTPPSSAHRTSIEEPPSPPTPSAHRPSIKGRVSNYSSRRRQVVSMIQLEGVSLPCESCLEVPGEDLIVEEDSLSGAEEDANSPDSINQIRGLINPVVEVVLPAPDDEEVADGTEFTTGRVIMEGGIQEQVTHVTTKRDKVPRSSLKIRNNNEVGASKEASPTVNYDSTPQTQNSASKEVSPTANYDIVFQTQNPASKEDSPIPNYDSAPQTRNSASKEDFPIPNYDSAFQTQNSASKEDSQTANYDSAFQTQNSASKEASPTANYDSTPQSQNSASKEDSPTANYDSAPQSQNSASKEDSPIPNYDSASQTQNSASKEVSPMANFDSALQTQTDPEPKPQSKVSPQSLLQQLMGSKRQEEEAAIQCALRELEVAVQGEEEDSDYSDLDLVENQGVDHDSHEDSGFQSATIESLESSVQFLHRAMSHPVHS